MIITTVKKKKKKKKYIYIYIYIESLSITDFIYFIFVSEFNNLPNLNLFIII